MTGSSDAVFVCAHCTWARYWRGLACLVVDGPACGQPRIAVEDPETAIHGARGEPLSALAATTPTKPQQHWTPFRSFDQTNSSRRIHGPQHFEPRIPCDPPAGRKGCPRSPRSHDRAIRRPPPVRFTACELRAGCQAHACRRLGERRSATRPGVPATLQNLLGGDVRRRSRVVGDAHTTVQLRYAPWPTHSASTSAAPLRTLCF